MHFTAYPTGLPLRCIVAGCRPGGTVLHPLTGSSPTGLAGAGLSPGLARLAAERIAQAVTGRGAAR